MSTVVALMRVSLSSLTRSAWAETSDRLSFSPVDTGRINRKPGDATYPSCQSHSPKVCRAAITGSSYSARTCRRAKTLKLVGLSG
ncbi:hypothetical protein BGZ61DRAFT_460209 [Ilyonectria robusta]|uniref:uncharacterized protein n=1 Tax=Ilyonectria robusta TaxID=1079257 RepID=UPI001E8DE848|nr:uncharacterized protein BGZ61DRAFT_460209 [Ilyonectria robusta]KAH8669913.1 hypothetical protein BGZ61DRAFT_460209 [Ilyonectria robusta]